MKHRGEIVERAVRQSGIPITKIARDMKRSRGWVYGTFDKPQVSIEVMEEIGKVIRHNFKPDLLGVSEGFEKYSSDIHHQHWKERYYEVLEKLTQSLEENKVLTEKLEELIKKLPPATS